MPERVAPSVAVIGGGITGLTTAYRLMRAGVEVNLLEAEGSAGGWVGTERIDGFICERGPLAWRGPGDEGAALLRDLELESRVVYASPAAKSRYFVWGGHLVRAPMNPFAFAASPLLTARGKARLLREPWVRSTPPDADESVAAFAARRFGAETARLVDPMVSGVFAGDSTRLSMQSAFPALPRWELDGGSVARGAIRAARARRRSGAPRTKTRLLTFPDGLGTLTARLAEALGPRLATGTRVEAIERPTSPAGGWRIRFAHPGRELEAGSVVLALPAGGAANLLRGMSEPLSAILAGIEFSPIVVACLDYPASAFHETPEGFGFLVPRNEGFRMLGALFVSSLFPEHAPRDRVSLRVLAGGAHDRQAVKEPEATLLETFEREIRVLLGATAGPRCLALHRHQEAIAHYSLGHEDRLAAIAGHAARLPGLFLAGSSYRGISIPDCICDGTRVATEVAAYLAAT